MARKAMEKKTVLGGLCYGVFSVLLYAKAVGASLQVGQGVEGLSLQPMVHSFQVY